MQLPTTLDAEVLRRYDRPGPRYTSYPTAPQFSEDFGEAELIQAASTSNGDPIPRRLSLYVHTPFCESPCFYCGCNRVITRDRSRAGTYIARLAREIGLVSALFDRDREAMQLHFGGGTPNFLTPSQLREVVETLSCQFNLSRRPERDVSIEIDPRFVTPDDIAELADIGFNRASLGVQDFDPAVQEAVNRKQGVEQTLAVIEACTRNGFGSTNVDLIYGLPRQTEAGFARTLETVVAARPSRVALYSYAHMPQLFKAQRQINAAELPSPEVKLDLLAMGIRMLTSAGFEYIGMDHFALPDDPLARAQRSGTLHRNFMGYTTHDDCELIGLGVSAISHVGECFVQNQRQLGDWERVIDSGRVPVMRGLQLNDDDRLRADVIGQIMCHGEIVIREIERRHGIDFQNYFAEDLARMQPLVDDGLVGLDVSRVSATGHGRLLLRNIAMCFDRYLVQPASVATPHFSRAI